MSSWGTKARLDASDAELRRVKAKLEIANAERAALAATARALLALIDRQSGHMSGADQNVYRGARAALGIASDERLL